MRVGICYRQDVIKGRGPGIFSDYYEREPRLFLWENRRKIETNKTLSCWIPIVSLARQLEILMTALYGPAVSGVMLFRAVIERRGLGISPGYYECGPQLLS